MVTIKKLASNLVRAFRVYFVCRITKILSMIFDSGIIVIKKRMGDRVIPSADLHNKHERSRDEACHT